MRALLAGFVIALAATGGAQAAGYTLIDSLTNPASASTTKWFINGTFGNPGGSLISKVPIPDGTAEYEIRSDFTLNALPGVAGGTFGHHVRSTSNASTATGSSFLTELQNPTFSANGLSCSATLTGYEIINTAVTTIFQYTVPCAQTMYMRTVVYGSSVITMINGQIYGGTTQLTSGSAGVSAHNVASGNSFSNISIYTRSHDVPAPVSTSTVGTSSFPNKVDFQWTEPTDTTLVGITQHYINRFDTAHPSGVLFYGFDGAAFTDATTSAATTYQYRIGGISFHGIYGSAQLFTVVTPAAGSIDPRRVGVRPTGSYWGGMGENIDTLSGNLNFSIPLLKAQGRKDSSIAISLSYNSQIWRHDNGGDWMLGQDVGYGLGWRLSPGSITPFWNGTYYTQLDHYTFVDSSGAEYRLYKDPSHPTLYISKESIYVTFDSNTNRLWFNNGTFWAMNCVSGGTESDFGTMYPTLIQDSNGNQVSLQYKSGAGTDWPNSSARIDWIQDIRSAPAGHHTYEFSYGKQDATIEAIQHLNTIRNNISTNENYDFYTLINRALTSPFTQATLPFTTTVLQEVRVSGYGSNTAPRYQFVHDFSTEELTKVILPTGGTLEWDYKAALFVSNRNLREVSHRYLTASADGTGSRLTYTVGRAGDAIDGSLTIHSWFTMDDPSGTQKAWNFNITGAPELLGTLNNLQSKVSGLIGADIPSTEYLTWTYDPAGNPYISQKHSQLDSGKSYQQDSYVTQVVNQYGSVIRSSVYDYTNSQTPIRIYETSHIADPGSPNQAEYADSRYIRDRVVNMTVKNHLTTETGILLSSATYDTANSCDTTAQPTVVQLMHDSSYNNGNKGNKTGQTTPSGTSCWMYDVLGNVYRTAGPGVPTTAITTNLNSNYAVPGQIQISGDAASISSFQFNNWMGLTNAAAPNGATSLINYDSLGRPKDSTSPLSVQTKYFYYPDPAPDTGFFPVATFTGQRSGQMATTAARHWTRTTLDGLGRVVRAESGDVTSYANSVSIVDTEYGPCACSPMGKMTRVSQPYKTGDTPVYTTYAYDALGRVTSVVAPDASTTSTAYQGNTTKVTDPAGKWKAVTRDVQGNTVLVTEPDPGSQVSSTRCDTRTLPTIAGGTGALQTCYTYDTLEHLTQVSMPRSTATQTRTFTFDPATQALASEKHPETGLSCYFYKADSSGRGQALLDKVIAKGTAAGATCSDGLGKTTQYLYDTYSRVTRIKRTPEFMPEDLCQRTDFVYDTTSLPGGKAWGRVGKSSTGDTSCTVIPSVNGSSSKQLQYVEEYSYNSLGQPVQKRLDELASTNNGALSTRYWDMFFDYSATAENLLKTVQYPDTKDVNGAVLHPGYTVTYQYDLMGRQTGMSYPPAYTGDGTPPLVLTSATYNPANQLRIASMSYNAIQSLSQERTYNSLNQLESVYFNGTGAWGYEYVGGQNNGQISVLHDYLAGQTISYGYDSLKRLTTASAASAGSAWSQAYTFDGFGNLTAKTGTLPQAVNTDPATNQIANGCYDKYGNVSSIAFTSCGGGNLYTYDVANRIVNGTGPTLPGDRYLYNAQNKRIAIVQQSGQEQLIFYGPGGQKMAAINGVSGYVSEDAYFAGMLWIQDLRAGNLVKVDRLGSVRGSYFGTLSPTTSYLPFGDEITPTANDREKFATYTRDNTTQFDYADQRFYNWASAKFMSADPYRNSAGVGDPGSWNKYSYVAGDPVNNTDPTGMWTCPESVRYCSRDYIPAEDQGGTGGGGSGDQGVAHGRRGGEKPSKNCDLNDPTNAKVINYIRTNAGAASQIASLTGLNADFILAWGALESGYGTGSAATKNNNFFGLTAPSKSSTGGWAGAVPCNTLSGTFAGFACFAGDSTLLLSGTAALSSQSGRYLVPALAAQASGEGLAGIGSAIAAAGFNSERINYGERVAGAAAQIAKRVDCP